MAGPVQDVVEEDAADLQFPKGELLALFWYHNCVITLRFGIAIFTKFYKYKTL